MKFFYFFILMLLLSSCGNKWKIDSSINKIYTEKDICKNELNAIVFLAPGCPLSEASLLELNKLQNKYNSKSYQTIIVISGKLFSRKEVQSFIDTFRISFPILLDTNAILINKLNATITPEYFLVDSKFNILYQGAIDNKALDNDLIRQEASINFAENAIKEYHQHKKITIPKTNPVGCYIEL